MLNHSVATHNTLTEEVKSKRIEPSQHQQEVPEFVIASKEYYNVPLYNNIGGNANLGEMVQNRNVFREYTKNQNFIRSNEGSIGHLVNNGVGRKRIDPNKLFNDYEVLHD